MQTPITVMVLSALVLTSCGTVRESRFNPMNWFGSSTTVRADIRPDQEGYNPLIPRRQESIFRQSKVETYAGIDVDDVTELHVERRPGGALIRAVGVTRYQGPYAVRLVKLDDESDAGTLTYALRAEQYRGPVGPVAARTVTAAVWVTDNELATVSTIRVRGRNNVRSSRR